MSKCLSLNWNVQSILVAEMSTIMPSMMLTKNENCASTKNFYLHYNNSSPLICKYKSFYLINQSKHCRCVREK